MALLYYSLGLAGYLVICLSVAVLMAGRTKKKPENITGSAEIAEAENLVYLL